MLFTNVDCLHLLYRFFRSLSMLCFLWPTTDAHIHARKHVNVLLLWEYGTVSSSSSSSLLLLYISYHSSSQSWVRKVSQLVSQKKTLLKKKLNEVRWSNLRIFCVDINDQKCDKRLLVSHTADIKIKRYETKFICER